MEQSNPVQRHVFVSGFHIMLNVVSMHSEDENTLCLGVF